MISDDAYIVDVDEVTNHLIFENKWGSIEGGSQNLNNEEQYNNLVKLRLLRDSGKQ